MMKSHGSFPFFDALYNDHMTNSTSCQIYVDQSMRFSEAIKAREGAQNRMKKFNQLVVYRNQSRRSISTGISHVGDWVSLSFMEQTKSYQYHNH